MARRQRQRRADNTGYGFTVLLVLLIAAVWLPSSRYGLTVFGWAIEVVLFIAAVGLGLWMSRRWWLPVYRWVRRRRAGGTPVANSPSGPTAPIAFSREPIPAGLRFAVLHRDGFRCAYCGRGQPDGVQLHIDHLVPVVAGGKNELDNLVTSCATCNLGKSARDVVGVDQVGPRT
jgi:hypothetical protein